MGNLSRRTFLELAGAGLVCGCSGAASFNGGADFPVLAFSDLHFNPLYDSTNLTLINSLVSANVSEWSSIFATSRVVTPSPAGTDTNYPLLGYTLASIKQHVGASPLLLYTGDLLGHNISTNLTLYAGITDPQVLQDFSNKTLSFVTRQIRSAAGSVPVMFTVGNCDSYTGFGPDSTFLNKTADSYYANLLNGSTDRQAFLASFTTGGYYAAEPAGMNIVVISLNTLMFSPLVQNKDGSENDAVAVDAELAWFDARLAAAKAAGKNVWLLMHAPPGADEATTAGAVNSSGHLASATMMWEPNYQATFLQTLAKYPGLITVALGGHTHMDEFRVLSAGNVLRIVPGISPCFGNDPAFKVFTIDRNTMAPTDYASFNYDLSHQPAQFSAYYQYSQTYPSSGSLGSSLEQLGPKLATDSALQALYRGYYYSGNTGASPITNTNWPVYWGGIGKMWAQELINAVNSY